jgi:uncharacterized protein YndB with AHSA1/START domain
MSDKTTLVLREDRKIVITRVFDAPARLVWNAYTDAALVRRWWAPRSRGVEMALCEADVRVGGKYRYVMRKGTMDLAFSGTYTQLSPHTQLSYTQIFEPMAAAGEVLVSVTFTEKDGKTTLESHELYPSKAVRDGTIASGMEGGMRESMNQLDAVIATLV